MTYACEISQQIARPTISRRTRTSIDQLPQLMGQIYGAIMQYLGEMGAYPTGAPFAAYHNMDMQDLDVEIGFPISKALPAKDDLLPGELPGGEAASCIHKGPYDGIGPAHEALMQFIGAQGRESTGVSYEFYVDDPQQVPPEKVRTEIVFPLQ